MIATIIFLLLLATVLSSFRDHRPLTLALFGASWLAMALLFWHHASSALDVSL